MSDEQCCECGMEWHDGLPVIDINTPFHDPGAGDTPITPTPATPTKMTPKSTDSYEVIHFLVAAIDVVRDQLDGTGRYIVDAAMRVYQNWQDED